MELTDYLRILRKRWILVVGIVVAAVLAAGGATLAMTPQYKASTQVFVSTSTESASATDLSAGNTFISQRVKSYAQAVTTAAVLEPVIKTLNLPYTVAELAAKVSANAPLNTVILEISVTDPDATQAAAIANAVGTTLPTVVSDVEKADSAGSSPVKISTLQPATVPTAPDSPNRKLNLALGLLVGIALAVGTAVLLDVLDTKVRTTRDIESLTEVAVIGGVPKVDSSSERALALVTDPSGRLAESFRSMRTNLQFVTLDRPNSFAVTSAVPGEGKTTTSASLALAIAQSGSNVICVDADLRRPRVDEVFGIEGTVGLTDVLLGRAELDDVVQPWGETGRLTLLPAGQVPPNPSELLGSAQMRELVARLESQYDVVVFDSAPLLPVTDTAVLSTIVGGTIVVVAASQTTKSQVAGALRNLGSVGAHVLGIALTMLPTKGPDAYSYSQYGYYGAYTKGDAGASKPVAV